MSDVRLSSHGLPFPSDIFLFLVGPDAEKVNYKTPGFLSKFLELQQVMWTTNAGLTDRHAYDSRPSSWPRLLRGIVRAYPCLPASYTYVISRTFGSESTSKSI